MLFVNLAVRDVKTAMAFFTKLGFDFDPRFTDEKAACLVIGSASYAMLISEPVFRTFTKREPCDTTRFTEGLFAVSCESRAEVDAMVQAALVAGGTPAMEPVDQGFMYGRSFYDLDGHHWEVVWMDPAAVTP
jgi:uncharacterized protein